MRHTIKPIILFILCMTGLALVFAFYHLDSGLKPAITQDTSPSPSVNQREKAASDDLAKIQRKQPATPDDSIEKQSILTSLRAQFGDNLHHPRIQIQAIEKLIRMLKKLYPDSWHRHVQEYLNLAFPDYAEELDDHYRKLLAYSKWAGDNRQALSGLPIDQVREHIWEARQAFFGDEALVIWEMELKQEKVRGVLGELNDQTYQTFETKAAYYREQLDEIYGDMSQAFIKAHQQDLVNKFLDVASVQDDLHAMNRFERKSRLTELRKSMGFGEDSLEQWETLDDVRDTRWATGQAYMTAREKLINSTSEDATDAKLNELRRSYFGDALAETIRKEEASGLFRFNRKRIYGRN